MSGYFLLKVFIIIILFGPNLRLDVTDNHIKLRSIESGISLDWPINSTIDILGNSQLASYASTGDGSASNPYIIENLFIDNINSEKHGISITNTDVFFILRNISLIGCKIGFVFSSVRNGIIEDSFVTTCEYGFSLVNSVSINLSRNTASKNWVGFEAVQLYNSSLTNNMAYNNLDNGFNLAYSVWNNITRNIASDNNASGYWLYESRSNIFHENIANNNSHGFYLDHSRYNTLINNTATNSTYSDYFEDEYSRNENVLINNLFPSYSKSKHTPSFLYISALSLIPILPFLKRKRRK